MPIQLNFYVVRSENLTGLGGPMGTERTWTNWIKYFSSRSKAMKYVERDVGRPVEWTTDGNKTRTQDLGHVMYHLKPLTLED